MQRLYDCQENVIKYNECYKNKIYFYIKEDVYMNIDKLFLAK